MGLDFIELLSWEVTFFLLYLTSCFGLKIFIFCWVIFGILGLKRKGRGMAIAGLCLGLLTYAIYAMIFLDFLVTFANS